MNKYRITYTTADGETHTEIISHADAVTVEPVVEEKRERKIDKREFGGWKYEECGCVMDSFDEVITDLQTCDVAKLIVAAPRMMRALIMYVNEWNSGFTMYNGEDFEGIFKKIIKQAGFACDLEGD